MRALIEARPGSWPQVFDLACSCAGEWVAATREPARPTVVVALIRAVTTLGVVFAASLFVWLGGRALAAGLTAGFGEGTAVPIGWVFAGDLALWTRSGIGSAISWREASARRPLVGPRELWFWVAWMVLSSAMHQWGRGEADLNVLLNLVWFTLYLSGTMMARRLAEARQQFGAAMAGLSETRRELWRLERLQQIGLPVSPEEVARALTHEMTCLHDVQRWRATVRKLQYPWTKESCEAFLTRSARAGGEPVTQPPRTLS